MNKTLTFTGGFNLSYDIHTLSKKGNLGKITESSESCTWSGDAPSKTITLNWDDPIPQVVVKTQSGNGGKTVIVAWNQAADSRVSKIIDGTVDVPRDIDFVSVNRFTVN